MTKSWPIPPGSKPSKCRSCNADIYWIKTPKGKFMPVNPDETSHFDTCPAADKHRTQHKDPDGPAPHIGHENRISMLEAKVTALTSRVDKMAEWAKNMEKTIDTPEPAG